MKAIILAGGTGSRLFPSTLAICKQLLPIYDKPMIYYPLSIIMLAGIRDILIIASPDDHDRFQKIFKDGSHLGLSISYAKQEKPLGIAHAFVVAKDFILNESVCLILGDNIFYGKGMSGILEKAKNSNTNTIFGYHVNHPESYGVVSFDKDNKIIDIEEKPLKPKSHYAVCGLYFYDNDVVSIARSLKPSKRKELEITDVNRYYLKKNKLSLQILGRGFSWLDAGTHDDFYKASIYIQTLQERQGIKIACIEEIAYRKGFINEEQLIKLSKQYFNNDYGIYLKQCADDF